MKFFRLLKHVKGRNSGAPFELSDWQRYELIEPLFGWKRIDGSRLYRRAFLAVPRKNGKSTLAAGIALYMLFADREQGAEVYSAAADREQAAIVFETARQMVDGSGPLAKIARVYRRSIAVPSSASNYRVLSADAYTKHGLNAHGIVMDELHAQPNRELFDVLATSLGAREQPLLVSITTAGYEQQSICREEWDYTVQVASGVIEDPSFLGVIYAAPEGADWTDPETWSTANPGIGVSIGLDYLQQECERAKSIPSYQNTFRRLHLNEWTSQDVRWLDLAAWDENAADLSSELEGEPCYVGLDLAATTDLAAAVAVFPRPDGRYAVEPHFFIPGEDLRERGLRDRVPYEAWSRDGHLIATPGDVIDYAAIRAKVNELGEKYHVLELAFDRWGSTQLVQDLEADGFTCVPFGQGFASMSAPSKELLRLILERRIAHAGHPVLRWNADNVAAIQDPAGNVKPDKRRSTGRIDGVVAAIMALDRAIRGGGTKKSVYEDRGLEVV